MRDDGEMATNTGVPTRAGSGHDARGDMSDGSAWTDLVAAMDRLVSPGGCPWDAEQTHSSLVKYLLEETHELVEAIETGDRAGIREELGDVLLQVVFHARIASEDPNDPFTADDVARDLVAKLTRRHPHVFAGRAIDGDLHTQWDAIKREEKSERTSILDGIPPTLGALAYAQKILGRIGRAGLDITALTGAATHACVGTTAESSASGGVGPTGAEDRAAPAAPGVAESEATPEQERIGAQLLALVRDAAAHGVDAEGALRSATRNLSAGVHAEEAKARGPREHMASGG